MAAGAIARTGHCRDSGSPDRAGNAALLFGPAPVRSNSCVFSRT